MSKEFVVNEYITVILQHFEPQIYLNEVRFRGCGGLIYRSEYYHPSNDLAKLGDLSMDGIIERGKESGEFYYRERGIDPDTKFWGYCSVLQAWAENEYNTKLLDSSFAFPLLEKLAKLGDPLAEKVLRKKSLDVLKVDTPQLLTT
jgi:hypothetical protein